MAFVIRSDRNFNFKEGEDIDVGPGQYNLIKNDSTISLNNSSTINNNSSSINNKNNSSTISNSKNISIRIKSGAPFNTSTERKNNAETFTPGVGTYNLRDINKKKHSFFKNTTNPNDPLINPLTDEYNEHIFISGEERFKEKNNNNYELIPDNFELLKNKKKSNDVKYLFQNNRPNYENQVHINSIPSKNSYGYSINEKGEICLQQNPENKIQFSGLKDDSIGPDRYEIEQIFSKQWGKGHAIDWSRSNSSVSKKNNKYIINNDDLSSTKNNSTIDSNKALNNNVKLNEGIKKEKNNNKKIIYKNKNIGFKDNTNKLDIDLIDIKKNKKDDFPGPGTYSPLVGILPPKQKLTKFQNFGSSESRFLDNIKFNTSNSYLDNIKLFPSMSYDLSGNKKFENLLNNKKRNIIYNDSITNEKNANILKKSIDLKEKQKNLVGPGRYDLTNKFVKPTSNASCFNVLERRFPIKNSETKTPGAGTYNLIHWPQPVYKQIIKTQEEESEIFRNYLDNKKYIEASPGVGQYSPEIVNSINYQNIKKGYYNKNRPPFNYNEERFKNYDNNTDIAAPGSYNLSRNILKENKRGMEPFSVISERKELGNEGQDINYEVGPGSYDRDSYFDWNKKSFNALFI